MISRMAGEVVDVDSPTHGTFRHNARRTRPRAAKSFVAPNRLDFCGAQDR